MSLIPIIRPRAGRVCDSDEMLSRCAIPIILCLLAGLAVGKPVALEPYNAAGKLTVSLPKGWTVTADLDKGVIAAQQDPKRTDSAAVLMVIQAAVAGTEDKLLDAVVGSLSKDIKVAKRSSLPDGRGRVLVATATIDKVKGRIGAVAIVSDGAAVVCLLAAKEGEFDKLGGTDLVVSIIATMRAPDAAPPTPPSTLPSTPTPAPTPPPPSARGTAVVLASVGLQDLVGEWGDTGGSTIDWVDSSSGEYRGTTASFFGASHTIAANGTFKYLFVGRSSNHTVRETDTGTVGFKDGFIVIKYQGRRADPVRTLRVMGFVTVSDGTTFMALVDAYTTQAQVHWDDPAYVANFCGDVVGGVPTRCVGGETWVRRPQKK